MSLADPNPAPIESEPAGTRRFEAARPECIGWHTHETGQFILVESGASHLYTEFGTWVIPARRLAWIPPRVRHASRPRGNGHGWVVIPPLKLTNLPAEVCVLRASSLMMSALQRVAELGPQDRLSALLWQVIAEEVSGARSEPPQVPLPSAPRLLKAARGVLANPTATVSLDAVASQAGMSRRSFSRHFRGQTGLSFASWRRAVIAQHALELVALGHKVSSVATDVGYESASAFIAMFRRRYGESPRQFFLDHSDCYLPANPTH